MEKTTKKKKTKRLKKRIGIIAVGGLSLVLTVCLSVGATLAWFAGSSWASKSLFMGGPVYVEMAGRGTANGTTGAGTAEWIGGDGSLDIKAAASRSTGTIPSDGKISDDVLLPGQKVAIYSQARVFSTAETNTVSSGKVNNESSGANTQNTSKSEDGYVSYTDSSGRITTATTSVLRARFSISVEFDPSVGFNNFTDDNYMTNYPVQSGAYAGDGTAGTWSAALGQDFTTTNNGTTVTYTGRRDGVKNTDGKFTSTMTAGASTGYKAETDDLWQLQTQNKTSIYSWKYVSESIYNDEDITADSIPSTKDDDIKYVKMGAPFDGSDDSKNSNGYYGVWILDSTGIAVAESDAFYKARTNAYLSSYVEYYVNEYGNTVTRSIKDSIDSLDKQLNKYFVQLVNDSSDNIISGKTEGFTVSSDGQMTATTGTAHNASWLYIDPSIGNDTNTNEISTSTGGWWYLVACNNALIATEGTGTNKITTVVDNVDDTTNVNTPTKTEAAFTRADKDPDDDSAGGRLDAMLYEIKPNINTGVSVGMNGTTAVNKVVSSAFPFVNGTFALPGDALTNVFANAKISFQISFQALQAFFPYTETIDGISYKDPKLGTAKALSIRNAIPIYNEAFDYNEVLNNSDIEGL